MAISSEIVAHNLEQSARELFAIGQDNPNTGLGANAFFIAGAIASEVVQLTGRTVSEQYQRLGFVSTGIFDEVDKRIAAKFN